MVDFERLLATQDELSGAKLSLWSIMRDHFFDWLSLILIIALTTVFTKTVSPYERYYEVGDVSLDYPLGEDTVSATALAAIVLSPVVVTLVTQLFLKQVLLWRAFALKLDLHQFLLTYFEALALNYCFTQFTKIGSGRLRPDFFARKASNDSAIEAQGHLSFCSGHSSFSFMAMVLIALYLSGKMCTFSRPKNCFAKFLVGVGIPIFISGYVAVSRTRDYMHDFADINAGALIGSFASISAYFLNFPSLMHTRCFLPKVLLIEPGGRKCNVNHSRIVNELPDRQG